MHTVVPDLHPDPFGERSATSLRRSLQLLGARVEFESNSRELLSLVDAAYAGLPRHRLSAASPRLRIGLFLTSTQPPHSRLEPAALQMLSGVGLLGGATASSDCVVVSPRDHAALVVVSPQMLEFPYHARYELLEFAVFTLAARVQRLVSLHAACVGLGERGVLLMGASGAGKSTLTLQCLVQGFRFVSEDSTFVRPRGMLATGVANFLHVRSDSLRWLDRASDVAAIRSSPLIRRRSGVKKFEVDLRAGTYRLAARPLQLAAVIFLSAESAGRGGLLRALSTRELRARLAVAQAYAASQPEWPEFCRAAARIGGYELRRGRRPAQAVEALQELLTR